MDHAKPSPDTGLACLLLLCKFHRVAVDAAATAHEHDADGKGLDGGDLVRAARKIGFRARLGKLDWERLSFLACPAICKCSDGGWVVFARYGVVPGRDGSVGLLHWPDGRQETLDLAGLRTALEGEMVSLSQRVSTDPDAMRFDLAWFVPMLVKHRWRVFEMLLASFVINILGLATPIGFQVVMDKVLVHRAYETLLTVGLGLMLAVVMESVLSTLRGYMSAHLGCRMDAHLGASVFRRLVRQPLEFFNARQVGEIVQRVREIESVRAFLVNGLINVVLDFLFIVVYLWVMWFYSPLLTQVVLLSLLVYCVIAMVMGPVIRKRVKRQYERQAANQAFMVETVKAIRTVKASALEPRKEEGWGRRLADYSDSSFSAALAGNYGSNAVQLVSRVTTVSLLGLGALEVIGGAMTVGALVAFNMLSQRVSQPVLRLAGLWQELQQVRVSLMRLSELMDSPTEDSQTGTSPSLALKGRVEFERVGFRYPNRDREVLRDVTFAVEPGKMVGVVGRSGSGKSTLVALLQRFYQPSTGRILVDGHNMSGLRPSWLRRQVGVVLQDNELFDGTVHDNIALSDPSMPFEHVEAAARLACAHSFITDELGNGYQTMVGEGGSKLSGGQRQRVAIARALASGPRLLILDEATSALDSESAAEFLLNLPQICEGRTVFIITHNLGMLTHCDIVMVMESGKIVERGTPAELSANDGPFSRLQRTGKL